MLLVATPNLCVDRTQTIADLVPGAVMRALEVEVSAGGKGVNIARVVRAHGRQATLVGLVADNDRAHLLGLLQSEGADVVDVPVPGDVRMAMIMIERPGGRTTVLNEPGSTISAQSWQHYRDAVERALPGHTVLACSGSLPPGAPVDAYGQLVELAHRAGIPALVDSAPAALRGSLASGPDLVTPNLQEAEAAISGGSGSVLADADADTDVRERATAAALTLCELGARAAAVTAGAAGVALASADWGQVRWVPTVQVDVISAVGAGDSFLAGVLLAVDSSAPGTALDWAEAVLRGAATATASCEQLRAGGVDPSRVGQLLLQIRELAADDSAMRSGA
jgi:1-phosphofructokinase family hexose kinase